MIVDKSIPGVTDQTFHIFLWLFVAAGVIFNVLVLIWRCARKESRFQLLSVLIVSLAVADILWCCHYLLQEVMMLKVIAAPQNETVSFTVQDSVLCVASMFLSFASANVIMTTAVGIALYMFFTLGGYRRRNAIIYIFLSLSWISCLTQAAFSASNMDRLSVKLRETPMSSNAFSVITMFGCMQDATHIVYPVIVTSVNAAASVACVVIYSFLLCKLRTNKANLDNSELKHLQIRLTIVVLVNVIVWWPPCIIFWYSYVRDETVFNGKLNVDAILPVVMANAIVTAIDPLIYTMVSTRFTEMIRKSCVGVCCHGDNEIRRLIEVESDGDKSCCGCSAICLVKFQVWSKIGLVRDPRSVGNTTDQTRSSHLFPDVKLHLSHTNELDSESA